LLIGYHFECNSDFINDTSLEMLRLWPNDNQILQTLNHSHQLARELAEFLQMLQPVELPIEIPRVVIIIDERYHHNEISQSINRRQEYEIESETSESDKSDISDALNEASVIIRHDSTEMHDDDYSDQMFNEGQSQLKIINENPNNLSIIDDGDSSKFHFICLIIRIFL
jgi:ribosomal protein L16 Arg81 hydroxylase